MRSQLTGRGRLGHVVRYGTDHRRAVTMALVGVFLTSAWSGAGADGSSPRDQSALRTMASAAPIRAVAAIDAVAIPAGSQPVRIDGSLGDDVWARATPVTEFVQRDPTEGAPASHA